MEDKIILKLKTKNFLNFYEIEPRSPFANGLQTYWYLSSVFNK